MISNAIFVALAFGASAQVPHWAKKPSLPSYDSMKNKFDKVMAMKNKFAQEAPKGRRLQKIMSAECESKCPGVKDMVMEMMKAATESTTPMPEGMSVEEAVMMGMMAMCPYADTLVCAAENKECQDEEPKEEDDPKGMLCMCKCKDGMMAMTKAGSGDTDAVCNDMEGTLGCFQKTEECASMMKDMNPGQMSGMCEWKKSGCEEKGEKCKTSEDNKVYDQKCDGIAEDKDKLEAAKDTCCTLGKSLVDCYSKECMVLMEASMSFEGDKAEKEGKKMDNLRAVCPDAGLPTPAEVTAKTKVLESAASGGDASGGEADAASSTPGRTVSAIAMAIVAIMVAAFV